MEFQVTFDAANPPALAEFWALALDYVLDSPPTGYASWDEFLDAMNVPIEERDKASATIDPQGRGPRLYFQKVPEAKAGKNRLHLDLRAAAGVPPENRMETLEARCEFLCQHGARRIERFEDDGLNRGWIVMADPEGNEFCLD